MQTLSSIPRRTLSMHPKKFLLWLFLISITMFFAALTSAYLVKRSQGDWIHFPIPTLFGYTTAIMALSSLSMQLAYFFAKQNRLRVLQLMLLLTLCTGIMFLWGQYLGWQQLIRAEVYWVGHPAGSFVYVLSGTHALHLFCGLIYLLVLSIQAFRYKIHSENTQSIQMCTTYWHFVGILWVYLYVFLLFNQ